MMAERIEAFCRENLAGGYRDGHEWRCGSVAGEAGHSMAVHLHGAKAGVWKDFATGETGDALDLVAAVLFGGNIKDAVPWAKHYLGLAGLDADTARRVRRRAATAKKRNDHQAAEEDTRKRRSAKGLWLASEARLRGTAVDLYLKGRGIDLERLGRQPGALRYHPGLKHPETQEEYPAMVSIVCDMSGNAVSCHRTFLEATVEGGFRKATDVQKAKLTLGRFAGGSVRIWRGASGKPLRQAPPDETVALTEGIEDALSVAIARPALRVLAAVSLANMANVELPDQVKTVMLCADNDDNDQARAQLDRAAAAHVQRGRRVLLARPPAGVKDFNELANKAEDGA